MSTPANRAGQEPRQPSRSRRSALLRLGTLSGLAGLSGLGFGFSGKVLAAVSAPNKTSTYVPELLTQDELQLTGVLAELIIPQTDTPGALQVGAHRTVDHLLKVCSLPPAQAQFKAGLARIDALAQAQAGKRFIALPPSRQTALLHQLDEGREPFDAADQRFFRQLKGSVAFAYYTSEAGATRELAYLPVPGGFKGKVKVTSATRTWAI